MSKVEVRRSRVEIDTLLGELLGADAVEFKNELVIDPKKHDYEYPALSVSRVDLTGLSKADEQRLEEVEQLLEHVEGERTESVNQLLAQAAVNEELSQQLEAQCHVIVEKEHQLRVERRWRKHYLRRFIFALLSRRKAAAHEGAWPPPPMDLTKQREPSYETPPKSRSPAREVVEERSAMVPVTDLVPREPIDVSMLYTQECQTEHSGPIFRRKDPVSLSEDDNTIQRKLGMVPVMQSVEVQTTPVAASTLVKPDDGEGDRKHHRKSASDKDEQAALIAVLKQDLANATSLNEQLTEKQQRLEASLFARTEEFAALAKLLESSQMRNVELAALLNESTGASRDVDGITPHGSLPPDARSPHSPGSHSKRLESSLRPTVMASSSRPLDPKLKKATRIGLGPTVAAPAPRIGNRPVASSTSSGPVRVTQPVRTVPTATKKPASRVMRF